MLRRMPDARCVLVGSTVDFWPLLPGAFNEPIALANIDAIKLLSACELLMRPHIGQTGGMTKPESRNLETAPPSIGGTDLRFLSVKDVALHTGLSRATIHRRVRSGGFPCPVGVSKTRTIWVECEVVAWLLARRSALRDD